MKTPFQTCLYLTSLGPDSEEDVWSDDPGDPGAATVYGISRAVFPDSPVWPIVDRFKKLPGFPKNMAKDAALLAAVAQTFQGRFWLPMGLDGVDSLLLQGKLYSAAVNLGTGTVKTYWILCLNSYNKKATLWPDLPWDASVLELAHATNAMCAEVGGRDLLYDSLNSWQDIYYHIGKDAFKALIEAVKRLGPRDWSERFEWGWHARRCLDAAQLQAKLDAARLAS